MASALKVYRCDECGVRTFEPFMVKETAHSTEIQLLCAMCADAIDPWAVSAREHMNKRRFSDSHVPTSRFRD